MSEPVAAQEIPLPPTPGGGDRRLILAALLCIQVTIGGHYAWSIFSRELIAHHGFSAFLSQVTYSVFHLFFAVSFLVGGRALERFGPRRTALAGAVLFGGGYALAGLLPVSVWSLAVCIGVLAGAGSGFCYITPIATAQKWFPEKKAFITGVIVAFFAFGAVLISLAAEMMLASGMALSRVFVIFGIVYAALLLLSARQLRDPAGYEPHREAAPFREILGDRRFWSMAVPMFAGLFAGLFVIGSLKNIGIEKGVTLAGFAVMFISACNGLGRVFWGWMIERVGEDRCIVGSLLAQTAALGSSLAWVSGPATFFVFAAVVGFLYACTLVAYASNTSRLYGVRRLSQVYGLLFLTNAAAGITAPIFGGAVKDATGSYDGAIATCALLCFAGMIAFLALRKPAESPTTD